MEFGDVRQERYEGAGDPGISHLIRVTLVDENRVRLYFDELYSTRSCALDETKDTLTHQRIYEAIEHLSQPSQKRMEASVDEQEDEMGASVFTEGPLGGPSKRARVA